MTASEQAPEPPRAGLVLVVDDDSSVRVVATRILQYGGYRVAAVESAREALAACERELPDLILSDWNMPGQDGVALLEAVRARHGAAAPKFAFMTAHDGAPLRSLQGVIAVIAKPFTMEQMLGCVAKHVAPRPGSIAAMRYLVKPG